MFAQPSSTEGVPFEPGSWTIVVVPDTQNAARSFPQVFIDSMQWIVDEKTNRNIQLMLHEGDIVDDNNTAQWQNAKNAISLLDGEVPYVLVTGNHDYGANGSSNNRTTLLNHFFSASDNPLNDPAQGGIHKGFFRLGELDNTYSTLIAPDGRKLLIFGLEFAPRQRVVDWANGIASKPQYQDHTAILLTHAYLEEGPPGLNDNPVGIRSNWDLFGSSRPFNPHSYGLANVSEPLDEVHDGEELWDELVTQNDIFELTLNGHYLSEGNSNMPEDGPATTALQTDVGKNGVLVHQMVANYQEQANGGNGYLRLLEFLPDGKTVRAKTYSPTLDRWLNDNRNLFSICLLGLGTPDDVD